MSAVKLRKVKRGAPVETPTVFLAEYSRRGEQQHVGTLHDRVTRQKLFIFRGSEEYVARMMRGVLAGLEQAERGERLQAYYCGANDNREEAPR